jgi:hypothetical protein
MDDTTFMIKNEKKFNLVKFFKVVGVASQFKIDWDKSVALFYQENK